MIYVTELYDVWSDDMKVWFVALYFWGLCTCHSYYVMNMEEWTSLSMWNGKQLLLEFTALLVLERWWKAFSDSSLTALVMAQLNAHSFTEDTKYGPGIEKDSSSPAHHCLNTVYYLLLCHYPALQFFALWFDSVHHLTYYIWYFFELFLIFVMLVLLYFSKDLSCHLITMCYTM